MQYEINNNLMSRILDFVKLLLLLISFTWCKIEQYSVFHLNNNYPLIYYLQSGETLALSGDNGFIMKFDVAGNIIGNGELTFSYGDISGFVSLRKGLHVFGSVKENENLLYVIDDLKEYSKISFESAKVSYLSLTLLNNDDILVNYITENNELYVVKYNLETDMKLTVEKSYYIIQTDKHFVSCIESIIPPLITVLCSFATSVDHIVHLNDMLESFSIINVPSTSQSQQIISNKIINLQDEYFALCSLKKSLSCVYGSIDKGQIFLIENELMIFVECSQNVNHMDIAYYEDDNFFATCFYIKNAINYIRIARVGIDKEESILKVLNNADLDSDNVINYLKISRFGGNYMSLFYHHNNHNVYRAINYPNCEDYKIEVYVLKTSDSIHVQSLVINLLEENDNGYFEFITLPEEGELKFANETTITKNTKYEKGDIQFIAGKTGNKQYTAKYRGISAKGNGRTCLIEILVLQCYEGCSTCSTYGNQESNQCEGDCLDSYYSISDKIGECRSVLKPPSRYYLDQVTIPNKWRPCFNSCETCSNIEGTELDHQCIICKNKYFKIENTFNCVQNVPPKHYNYTSNGETIFKPCYFSCSVCITGLNSTDHNCIECKENYYKIEKTSSCYIDPLERYFLDSSVTPHLFKKCDSICKICKNNPYNCIECNSGYYMDEILDKCIKDCGDGYLDGDVCRNECSTNLGIILKRCINCKQMDYFNYKGKCIEEQPLKTYISNSEYNIVKDCDISCLTCKDNELNCLSCESGYLFQENRCVSSCNEKYVEDRLNRLCVNCKLLNPPLYKWKKDNQCIDLPPRTYVSDKDYNIIEDCFEFCETCSIGGNSLNHNCDSCLSNMIIHPKKEKFCVIGCDLTKSNWYVDKITNDYLCTDDNTCRSAPGKYLDFNTKECAFSCDSSLYEYNLICYTTCPADSIPDNSMKCLESPKCKLTSIEVPLDINNLSDINRSLDTLVNNYIFANQKLLTSIEWFSINDSNFRIFKSDECNYNLSLSFNIDTRLQLPKDFAYFNFTACQEKLKADYGLESITDVVVIMIDTKETNETSHQLDYSVYSSITGKKLDIAKCKGITNSVYYPIQISQENSDLVLKMKTKEIDVFNPIDPFFNNYCIPYQMDNGRDIILKDRRKNFFMSIPLCENKCTYINMDYSKLRPNCLCEIKLNFLETSSNYTLLTFVKRNKTQNNVMNCYSSVFNSKYFAKNYGSWMCLIIFLVSLCTVLVFFLKEIGTIASFLEYNYSKSIKSNPPNNKQTKRDKNKKNNPCESAGVLGSSKSRTQLSSLELNKNDSNIHNPTNLCQKQKKTSFNRFSSKKQNKIIQEELDDLTFLQAIQKDRRSFLSLHWNYMAKVLFGLNLCTNYSIFVPLSLKIASLCLNLSFLLILNIIQFSEGYISTRYHSVDQLVSDEIIQSIITGIICSVLGIIVTYCLSFRKRFTTLQNLKEKNIQKYQEESEKTFFKFKFAVGFILVLTVVLSGFFWYYASAFCAVYPNTQLRWFFCSGISLVFCFIFQEIIVIIVTLFRFISLKYNWRCCYYISQIIF